ncbi:MAG: hypothetical protein EA353_06325 [Puniceicoccaceae bacterium]|nr:MAG: hypothetical protein EA353_06325 [Puniceicoccaceae bacterium]
MTREEAQQRLELCRPGVPDDRQDPALAEAFALLESDAELSAWFEAQQAVDARISQHLEHIEAPADLEHRILAGMRLHAAHKPSHPSTDATQETAENSTPFPSQTRPRILRFAPWVGLAALFLFALILLKLPSESPTPNAYAYAGIPADIPSVIQFLSNEIDSLRPSRFDMRDASVRNLQDYLTSHQSPSPQRLPALLEEMPTIGCVTFEYKGAKLSMICFKNGAVYHLITAEKASYPDELGELPQIFEIQDKAFKLWIEGDQVKILTIHGSQENFPEFI